jgi:transposase
MRKKQSSHNSVETKLEAVRQVLENKRPVAEVAIELDLHRDTVNRWIISFKDKGEQGLVNPRSISHPSQSKDIKKTRELEKKLKEKEMEIEILKKFQAFLKGNE